MKIVRRLLKNKLVQFALVFLVGAAIGALFYPTKHIEERISARYEQFYQGQIETAQTELKQERESVHQLTSKNTQLMIESSQKISELKHQIKDLESHQKESYFKIVKPDGTIVVRKFKESDTSESSKIIENVKEEYSQHVSKLSELLTQSYKDRISSMETDFNQRESQYQKTIDELRSERVVDINPKKYGVEVGYLTNKSYYGHVNIDVFGPVFIGLHTQSDFLTEFAVGGGVGLRF